MSPPTQAARDVLDQFEAQSSERGFLDYRDQDLLLGLIDTAIATATTTLRKDLAVWKQAHKELHAEQVARVEANIARARPLGEASAHYALHNTLSANAPYGALEMAFIQGANWQKESGT